LGVFERIWYFSKNIKTTIILIQFSSGNILYQINIFRRIKNGLALFGVFFSQEGIAKILAQKTWAAKCSYLEFWSGFKETSFFFFRI
jgi:hypothetical protein